MTLAELAGHLGCRLEGATDADGAQVINRVNSLDEAGPGDLTFLTNPRFTSRVAGTKATAILADDTLSGAPCPILRTATPAMACASAIGLLTPKVVPVAQGVHPLAAIDPAAVLGIGVAVGPFAVVGPGARVGAGTVLHHTSRSGRRPGSVNAACFTRMYRCAIEL